MSDLDIDEYSLAPRPPKPPRPIPRPPAPAELAAKPPKPLAPALRLLPTPSSPDAPARAYLFHFSAIAIALAYAFFLFSFFAPSISRPGIDENAYLLAGRNFVEHATAGFHPDDDYEFVGAMWVRTEDKVFEPAVPLPGFLKHLLSAHPQAGWYYPKYPAGIPFLNGVVMLLTGGAHSMFAAAAVLAIPPASAALAVLGMFYLTRALTGSGFLSLLAMIALAFNPTALEYAHIPGSHATDLCFVVWGMFLLTRWWQTATIWRGVLAGLLLGYAVTLRYTEALLLFPLFPLDQVLSDTSLSADHPHIWQLIRAIRLLPIGPIGLAVFCSIRYTKLTSYLRAAVPLLAWSIPVGLLVAFNWFTMGHATGYDTTNESAGFTTAQFLQKWDFTIHQVYLFGLFLLAPLGLTGLILLHRISLRLGLFLTLWFLPGAALYTCYYWGASVPGVGYLRFFLSLLPPLILGAMWLLRLANSAARPISPNPSFWHRGSLAAPIAAGILVALTTAVALDGSLPNIDRQYRGNLNLALSLKNTAAVLAKSPNKSRPVIFADEGVFPQFLQAGQFVIPATWYCSDAFELRAAGGFGFMGVNAHDPDNKSPVLVQKQRILYAESVRKDKTKDDLAALCRTTIQKALDAGHPVYAILTPIQTKTFTTKYLGKSFDLKELSSWTEPCAILFDQPAQGRRANPLEKSPLHPTGWSGEPLIHWQPQKLKMYAIEPKSPTTKPTLANNEK